MTDLRHCDGPNCEQTSPLRNLLGPSFSEQYITVECEGQITGNLHFHTKQCLIDYYKTGAQ